MHEQINHAHISVHESALIHLESIVKWLKQKKAEMLMDGISLPIPEHKLREYKKIKKRKQIPASESILPQHAEVLFILLNAAGPLPLSAIKENMVEKSSDVSRLVEKLELIGLVENRPHRGNRQKHDISLTEYGMEKTKLFHKNYQNYVQFVEQQLKLDEAEFLIQLMSNIASSTEMRSSMLEHQNVSEVAEDIPDWVVEEGESEKEKVKGEEEKGESEKEKEKGEEEKGESEKEKVKGEERKGESEEEKVKGEERKVESDEKKVKEKKVKAEPAPPSTGFLPGF